MKHFLILLLLLPAFHSIGQLPAFKGAEGFGALASGGRGKEVVHVTTLEDAGPGSFREAVSSPGRTVVFDVGGVIKLRERINVASDITIAGQTAPGPGITLYGQSVAFNKISNVIVRYIRLHGSINMAKGSCVLIADSSDNLIFDHVSVTWGRWDDLHIKGSTNITLQYCLIGESLDPQRFGALLERPANLSIHHCLWIDNQSRNPKAKAGIEYINNVIYNWGNSGLIGGHSAAHHYQDIIGNYFIAGPSSSLHFLSMFTETDHVYQQGNWADTNKDGQLNGIAVTGSDFTNGDLKASLVPDKQHKPALPVTVEPAAEAYRTVLAGAGCCLQRDPVDERLISQLKSLGRTGDIIWTELMVKGQPKIDPVHSSTTDADHDGIPDDREKAHQSGSPSASNTGKSAGAGYTDLEIYLESLVP